jgi:hypothetical protein
MLPVAGGLWILCPRSVCGKGCTVWGQVYGRRHQAGTCGDSRTQRQAACGSSRCMLCWGCEGRGAAEVVGLASRRSRGGSDPGMLPAAGGQAQARLLLQFGCKGFCWRQMAWVRCSKKPLQPHSLRNAGFLSWWAMRLWPWRTCLHVNHTPQKVTGVLSWPQGQDLLARGTLVHAPLVCSLGFAGSGARGSCG